MKKNKFMKLASGLLVLCLMTTCVIGATLAKYVTSGNSQDSARVAKWGVTVSTSGTLFGKNYGANNAGVAAEQNQIVATSTNVASADDDKVVAPGTKNDTGLQLKVAGEPEVASAVTVTAEGTDIYLKKGTYGVMVVATGVNAATDMTNLYIFEDSTYKKVNTYVAGKTYYQLLDKVTLGADYHPVVWQLDDATKTMKQLVEALNGPAQNYDANATINVSHKITWAWGYEVGATEEEKATNNKADTILGNIQAANVDAPVVKLNDSGDYVAVALNTDYSLNVTFNVSITATQID